MPSARNAASTLPLTPPLTYPPLPLLPTPLLASHPCSPPLPANQVIDAHDIKDGVSVTDVRRVILRLKPRRNGKRKGEGGRLCGVRLRVMRQSTSGEHKFKLMSLLLGGSDASDLQTFSMRVAAQAAEDDGKGKGKKRGGGRRKRSG